MRNVAISFYHLVCTIFYFSYQLQTIPQNITTGQSLAFSGTTLRYQTLHGIVVTLSNILIQKEKRLDINKLHVGGALLYYSNLYRRFNYIQSAFGQANFIVALEMVIVCQEPEVFCISVGMRQWPWLIMALCYWCLSVEKMFPLTCFDSGPKTRLINPIFAAQRYSRIIFFPSWLL